jgi:hypothetical protein
MSYASFIELGMKRKTSNPPADITSPLTYCVLPTANTYFLHGFNRQIAQPSSPACQEFMADYCSSDSTLWDGFCQAYQSVNRDWYWPNSVNVNGVLQEGLNRYLGITLTTGDALLHNAATNRFLVIPNETCMLQPFDRNVADSPMYKTCQSAQYSVVRAGLKNLGRDADGDALINKMIQDPKPVVDVLLRIYIGWKSGEIDITGTRLEQFLKEKSGELGHLVSLFFTNNTS